MNSTSDITLYTCWVESASALTELLKRPVTGGSADLQRWRKEVVELANTLQGHATALAKSGLHLFLPDAVEQQLRCVQNAFDSDRADPDTRTRTPEPESPSLPPSSQESSSDCYIIAKSPEIIQIDSDSDDQLGPERKTTSALLQDVKQNSALQKGKEVDRNLPEQASTSRVGASNPIGVSISSTVPGTPRNAITPNMFHTLPVRASKLDLEAALQEHTRLSSEYEAESQHMLSLWNLMLELTASWKIEREDAEEELRQLLQCEEEAVKS